jgi:hypothetical protein
VNWAAGLDRDRLVRTFFGGSARDAAAALIEDSKLEEESRSPSAVDRADAQGGPLMDMLAATTKRRRRSLPWRSATPSTPSST